MDRQDVSAELQRTQERYLRWRDVRQDMAEADAEAPLGQFLSNECLVLEPEAPLADRETLRAPIDALEDPIKEGWHNCVGKRGHYEGGRCGTRWC